jgi:DNA-binding transcriptional LysR family regulator
MVSVPLTLSESFSIVGSPAYFSRHGHPSRPEELSSHACINFRMTRGLYRWEVQFDGQKSSIGVDGPLIVKIAALALAGAEAGIGLAYLMDRHVKPSLEEGWLERALEGACPPNPGLPRLLPGSRPGSAEAPRLH